MTRIHSSEYKLRDGEYLSCGSTWLATACATGRKKNVHVTEVGVLPEQLKEEA